MFVHRTGAHPHPQEALLALSRTALDYLAVCDPETVAPLQSATTVLTRSFERLGTALEKSSAGTVRAANDSLRTAHSAGFGTRRQRDIDGYRAALEELDAIAQEPPPLPVYVCYDQCPRRISALIPVLVDMQRARLIDKTNPAPQNGLVEIYDERELGAILSEPGTLLFTHETDRKVDRFLIVQSRTTSNEGMTLLRDAARQADTITEHWSHYGALIVSAKECSADGNMLAPAEAALLATHGSAIVGWVRKDNQAGGVLAQHGFRTLPLDITVVEHGTEICGRGVLFTTRRSVLTSPD